MKDPKTLFIDADAFVALNYQDDPSHKEAVILSREIKNSNVSLT